jgi:hypothetical protein
MPPAPSTIDTLYPLCYRIIQHITSEIDCLEVDLHYRHTRVSHTHTPVLHLPLEFFASTHTNDLYEWKLSCRKIPSQNQQGNRCDSHNIQPGPHIRTSCRRRNSTTSSQLSHSVKILPHIPYIIDQSITLFINCSLLQSLNLGQTNSYTLDYCHLVLHPLAHVQIKRTATAQQLSNSHSQLRKPKGKEPTHRPSTPCALQ